MAEVWLNDVRFTGGEGKGFFIRTVDGWRGAPDSDTEITKRKGRSGSFSVSSVRRGSRVVSVSAGFEADGTSHAQIVEAQQRISGMSEQIVKMRVVDEDDSFVTGILDIDLPATWDETITDFAFTVACQDPYRYSTTTQSAFLQSQASSTGGLGWGPDDDPGIVWDLDWGDGGTDGNSAVLRNAGNSSAYPVITVHGDYPQGVTLMDSAGRALVYTGPILSGSPLTLDCGRRFAMAGGVSRGEFLSSREWFSIPAGGDIGISFLPTTTATGWAEVAVRDTYI